MRKVSQEDLDALNYLVQDGLIEVVSIDELGEPSYRLASEFTAEQVARTGGGVGKTTLTVNLGVEAMRLGQLTGIVDTDPQASTTAWKRVRTAETPLVVTIAPSGLDGVLKTARSRSYRSVWVDSAPRSNVALTESARAADYAIIPILPSPADVLTAYESAGIAKAAGIPFGFVLNSVPAGRSQEAADSRTVLAKLGHVFETEIHDRLAYRRTFGAGLAIVETTDLLNKPGRDEVAALFTEIWSAVNG
jgi:chromosome partitioning protein